MKFSTIALDAPWQERGGGKIKRGADRHYKVMKTDDIIETILSAPVWYPADDAHLYLWVTNNFLRDGLYVMESLGFRYVTNVVWDKQKLASEKELKQLAALYEEDPVAALAILHDMQRRRQMGLGQYFRGVHELLLFGVRGQGYAVKTDSRSVRGGIAAPRQKHSEKPQAAYNLIEARSKGPYLEMFAREQRPGWTVWGDEV
jgi:N6-adenosine-specific RNA methylase IME4